MITITFRKVLLFGVAAVTLQSASRSVWEGVYTDDQAVRGNGVFMKSCAECHDVAAEFSGSTFLDRWKGQTAFEVYNMIRTEMPKDNPGTLTNENYVDLVAFMFKSNSFPSAKTELEAKDDTLKQIRIEPKPR